MEPNVFPLIRAWIKFAAAALKMCLSLFSRKRQHSETLLLGFFPNPAGFGSG